MALALVLRLLAVSSSVMVVLAAQPYQMDSESGHWWPVGHPRRVETGQSLASSGSGPFHAQTTTLHFAYERELNGPVEFGPAHWTQIDARCGGSAQSPIDIADATYDETLTPLSANWGTFTGHVINNGHTVQVNVDYGNGNVTGGPLLDPYYVAQFHVHYNSEHTINGAGYPLELHVVHVNTNAAAIAADATKELTVVAFFFKEGETASGFFEPIISSFATLNTSNTVPVAVPLSSLATLLPDLNYFTYKGSLTAPNCRESVTWLVTDTVLTMSGAQLDAIRAQFVYNNRPVQELNGRLVRTTKSPLWAPWSTCSVTCGSGTQTRTCLATSTVLCNTGISVRACSTSACLFNSSSDSSSGSSQTIVIVQAVSDGLTLAAQLAASAVGIVSGVFLLLLLICIRGCRLFMASGSSSVAATPQQDAAAAPGTRQVVVVQPPAASASVGVTLHT